ncbi:hypothetical protein Lser_V15G22449 [Lactuca serriola]
MSTVRSLPLSQLGVTHFSPAQKGSAFPAVEGFKWDSLDARVITVIVGKFDKGNCAAGKIFGIPLRGTHSQAFVSSFMRLSILMGVFGETNKSELAAFILYALAFPDNFLALVDTCDFCGTAAGLGATWSVSDVSKVSTVAIFGLGTVAQGAKIRGASTIIGVDTNPEMKEKAKAFGVTDFINPNDIDETVQQAIKRLTDGGVEYSFECIGDTEMINTALHSCCDGWGVTVTLGVPKTNPNVACHYGLFITGRTLKGSLFRGWKPKLDIPSALVPLLLKSLVSAPQVILGCYLI